MNIHVHIDRLVLDGLSLRPAQRLLVQAALKAELVRLLVIGGSPRLVAFDGRLSDNHLTDLGEQIARSVHRVIARERVSVPETDGGIIQLGEVGRGR